MAGKMMGIKQSLKKYNSRKFLLAILVFFIVVVVGGFIAVSMFLSQLGSDKGNGGNNGGDIDATKGNGLLVVVKDGVSVERAGKSTKVKDEEYQVQAGDIVATDKTGSGYIIFTDNSSITLDVNTKIKVEQMDLEDKDTKIKLTQFLGKTWSRVEKLIGKEASYEVETPNTVAAVRGTQFSCLVESEKVSECEAIEHNISLKLKNLKQEKNEVVLDEGNKFVNDFETDKVEDLTEKIEKRNDKKDDWREFNECLAEQSKKILDEGGRVINNLQVSRDALIDCYESEVKGISDETSGGQNENTNTQTDDQTGTETVVKPVVKLPLMKNVKLEKISSRTTSYLKCTWNAENADFYWVAIGRSGGGQDFVKWMKTSSKEFVYKKPVSDEFYICSVKAVNQNATSKFMASNKLYFEKMTGIITSTNPNDGGNFYGSVSGTADLTGVRDYSHIVVFYSIKRNSDGKYAVYDGGWSDSPKSYSMKVTDNGGGNVAFITPGNHFQVDYDLTVEFFLKNSINGRKLYYKSVVTSGPPIIIN